MAASLVPLTGTPQKVSLSMGGQVYMLRTQWCDPSRCWVLSISDVNDGLLLSGIPLITGADLLAQYDYLAIGGAGAKLVVQSNGDPTLVPNYALLGTSGFLYFLPGTP